MNDIIINTLKNSIELKKKVLDDKEILEITDKVAEEIVKAIKNGCKILFAGNGGSAADAQHLAAEFTGRFYFDRDPLFAEALHVNTSYITAVANDYSYDEIYSRLVKAKGKRGDVIVGLSTSGNSKNIIEAFKTAKELGMITVGFTGEGGGAMKVVSDYLIAIPSKDTPRIQESHITLGHAICQIVEEEIFGKK